MIGHVITPDNAVVPFDRLGELRKDDVFKLRGDRWRQAVHDPSVHADGSHHIDAVYLTEDESDRLEYKLSATHYNQAANIQESNQ